MDAFSAYAGLFAASFLAATVLPFQSEAMLVGLILAEASPWWALLAVATIGNALGTVISWLVGRFLLRFRERRWFPVGPDALARVERWFARYGVWSLLLAGLPVLGDPLMVMAGAMRVHLLLFLMLVTVGKLVRYGALAAATLGWT